MKIPGPYDYEDETKGADEGAAKAEKLRNDLLDAGRNLRLVAGEIMRARGPILHDDTCVRLDAIDDTLRRAYNALKALDRSVKDLMAAEVSVGAPFPARLSN